jgi:hypothetical protein
MIEVISIIFLHIYVILSENALLHIILKKSFLIFFLRLLNINILRVFLDRNLFPHFPNLLGPLNNHLTSQYCWVSYIIDSCF